MTMTTDTPTSADEPVSSNGSGQGSHTSTDAAARMAHEFIDRVARVAQQSEERIRNAGERAETSLKHSLDTARDKSAAARTSAGDFVQQHPFAALGLAFGVGVLVSYLTRGSRTEHNDDD